MAVKLRVIGQPVHLHQHKLLMMNQYNSNKLLSVSYSIVCLLIVLTSCKAQEEKNLVQKFGDLENVKIYSLAKNIDSVLLKKEMSFGDTDNVFYSSLGEFTVDDSGRVYISDAGWGSRSLHVYHQDGTYLGAIAGDGRGPAEFQNLSSLEYNSGRLLFYDSQLQRIMLYSTKTLEPNKTVLLDPQKWKAIQDISGKGAHEFYLESDDGIIAAFQESPTPVNAGKRTRSYYRLNSELEIISEKLKELKAKRFIHSNSNVEVGNTQVRFMKHFPFFERHFFIPASNGQFYTVESSDFLVRKYDRQGNYLRAFYYPVQSPKVVREDAVRSANDLVESIADNVDFPESWPVINHIFLDDENRFWVSTIMESDEYFQWWVLDEAGQLLGKFKWPGDKYQDPASLENHVIVKDGYFYQRKKSEDDGTVSVIQYKIQFEEFQ